MTVINSCKTATINKIISHGYDKNYYCYIEKTNRTDPLQLLAKALMVPFYLDLLTYKFRKNKEQQHDPD